ncbi:MAG: hypothetical protein BGN85_00470 [Alphaproteobacteria bacterium 64-11]|nr:MAG: hypothetical protein BGN85_00470 [Alphaproteobacteria bacterium 64-11]
MTPGAKLSRYSQWGIQMLTLLKKFAANEDGATAIEYGLIAALIAVVVISAVTLVGTNLSTTFTTISGNLK